MKLTVYRPHREIHFSGEVTVAKGDWYWRVTARNGRKVAVGGEGYKRRQAAMRMARLVTRATSYVVVDGATIIEAGKL